MKILKVIAVASAVASLSACAGMGYERPYADRTSYVAPRASMDPAMAGQPGAGAAGGGGAGAQRM
jgi:hypothetical protein